MSSFHQLSKLAPVAAVAAVLLLNAPDRVAAQAEAQPPPQPQPQPQLQPQAPAPAEAPPDQVSQLAQMIGLSEEQQTDIRTVIADMEGEIEVLQGQAETLHEQLDAISGHDFDEDEVRETAAQLGEISGAIVAKSVILQSTVEGIFTEEQRAQLDQIEAQQRQQQELQQQQLQQQLQQQFEQQEQPAPQAQPQPQAEPQPLPAPQP